MRPAEAAPNTVRGETAVRRSGPSVDSKSSARRQLGQRLLWTRGSPRIGWDHCDCWAGRCGGRRHPKKDATTPTFERGHTGLTPAGKRQCLEAKDGDDEDEADDAMTRRLSLESVASVASCCTVFTDYDGEGDPAVATGWGLERGSCWQRTSAEWGQPSFLGSGCMPA